MPGQLPPPAASSSLHAGSSCWPGSDMLLFSAAQRRLPCSAGSAPCEFTADRPASIIARLRRQSRHDGSGIDQKLGGGGEVKLFRGGASWGRRGVLCFSASEDSMRCISYTGPGHVEGFSGQAKDRPSPRGVPHPHSYPTPNRASAVLPTSSHGPVVLDCSHP